VSVRKDRRVLDRTAAAIRDSDAGLGALFESFAARTAGQAMPKAEYLARRAARPAAVLVFLAGIVLAAVATAFAIAATSPCTGSAVVAYYAKAPRSPAAASTGAIRGGPAPSCPGPARSPARPGTDRLARRVPIPGAVTGPGPGFFTGRPGRA
jgi:hypothetical protein